MFVEKPSKAVLKLDGKLEFVGDFFRTHIQGISIFKGSECFWSDPKSCLSTRIAKGP